MGQATWPASTSTFIWNEDGGLLVDALITVSESELLAEWVADHGAPGLQGQVSPAALQVWGGFFPSQLTNEPIVPEALSSTSLSIGDSAATLIALGATDTQDSSVVHVPQLHLVVAGDAVYNRVHVWLAGSTPESRAA